MHRKIGRKTEAGYPGREKTGEWEAREVGSQGGGKPGRWEDGKVGRKVGVGGCTRIYTGGGWQRLPYILNRT